MWSIILDGLQIVLAIFLAIIGVLFLRAVTARVVTGKWPHQSEASRNIYQRLP